MIPFLLVPALWGFAEATFFFLVPDVWLSFLALEGFSPAVAGSLAALAGALHGGALLWIFGRRSPVNAFTFVTRVPGIGPALIEEVRRQAAQKGAGAVFLGPLRGIPYKIYAVEAGATRRSLAVFLSVSIPARYLRFFLVAGAFWLAGRYPLAGMPMETRRIVVGLFWLVFYAFYFRKFGWRGR